MSIRAPQAAWQPRIPGSAYDRVIEEKAADLSGYGLQTPVVELTVTAKDGKSRKASHRR